MILKESFSDSLKIKIKEVSILSNEEKMQALAIPDFFNRNKSPDLSLNNMKILFNQGKAKGYINYNSDSWVTFRDPFTLLERHCNNGGYLEFPVTEVYFPEYWKALIQLCTDYLKKEGKEWAFIECPADSQQAINTIASLGFKSLGQSVNVNNQKSLGYTEQTIVFGKHLGNKTKNFNSVNLFPYAGSSKIRSQAKSSDAPTPDSIFWNDASSLYSGFSAYPFMEHKLEELIGKHNFRSFLSAPCATGDALRFLPIKETYEKLVGMDITPVSLYFAEARLKNPTFDVFNRFLINLFYDHALSATISKDDIIHLLKEIGHIFDLNLSETQWTNIFVQMKSAFITCIKNPVIADYWILLKGIAAYVFQKDLKSGSHPLSLIIKLFDSKNFIESIYWSISKFYNWTAFKLTQELGEQASRLFTENKIELKNKNVLELEDNEIEQFECIYIFEALLMFHAAGKEKMFLDTMIQRLKPCGTIILTGIRNNTKLIPVELKKASQYLKDRGFKTYEISVRIEPKCLIHADMNEQNTPFIYAVSR